MNNRNILLVGVGGQGTILASKILAWIGLEMGQDVKMSEIHGMAQRGGSVTTQICMAPHVYSPVIEPGEADTLLSFELLEAKRSLHFLQKNGLLIVNDQRLQPMSVITGAMQYPDDILTDLAAHTEHLQVVPAAEEALKLGNVRAANVVLLGALSAKWTDIPLDIWHHALERHIPARHAELNMQAFAIGRAL